MTTSRTSKTIEIPEFMDSRGSLYVKEFRDLPFIPKRLYYIKDVPTLETRGAHAHRSCHQILIALQGSLDVELIDSNGNITYNLSTPKIGLHIPPFTWGVQKNFDDKTILLVLASETYDKKEYIEDFEEFCTLISSHIAN